MNHITKKILSVIVTAVMVAGCNTDELQDLNLNPQAVTKINLNFMFTAAQLGAASGGSAGDNRYIDWRTNIGMCSMAIQQLANAGGGIAPGDKYTENFETSNAPFEFIYGDQLKQLTEILKQTGDDGFDAGNKKNLREASRILRAFLYQRLTDYYGRVPYSEAMQATTGGEFFPKYDKQSEIYTDLLKEVDEATTALNAANPDDGFAAADLYYGGNIAKWKKFGNSLMLRMAMRISNVSAAQANTYIAKAVAGGVFASNDDSAWVPMSLTPSEWTNQNGISRAFYPGDGGQPSYLSKTLVDWLKGTDVIGGTADDDPRLMIISGGVATWTPTTWTVTKGAPVDQKGMPNGKDAAMLAVIEGGPVDQEKTYSRINFLMLQDDEPYMLMNYAEVKLLLAEASNRGLGGLTPAVAAGHYNEGVKAAMQQYTKYDATLTVTDAAVTTYLTAYPYVAGAPGLEMIGRQLWLANFMNWWEAWSNWRRTGFPVLIPVNYPGNETGGTIPVRLRYPAYEATGNAQFAATATTPNTYTTKLWWAGGVD